MTRLIMEAGPLLWPILALVPVITLLTLWNAGWLLAGRADAPRRRSIDGVLFWGALAAAIGFLGQWLGIFRLTRAIAARGVVNPQAVAYGISESLLTPIAGMAVLLAAAGLWFLLRLGLWSRARHD